MSTPVGAAVGSDCGVGGTAGAEGRVGAVAAAGAGVAIGEYGGENAPSRRPPPVSGVAADAAVVNGGEVFVLVRSMDAGGMVSFGDRSPRGGADGVVGTAGSFLTRFSRCWYAFKALS